MDIVIIDGQGGGFGRALIEALQSAEHFIFLEYFIIEEGDVWGRILKILESYFRQMTHEQAHEEER